MIFYKAKTPAEYQEFFHLQIGLPCTRQEGSHCVWENPQIGYIHSFGSIDSIQTGIAHYTVPCDFIVDYQYSSQFLHFGIVFDGITYSIEENKMVPISIPSAFLTIKNTSGGIHCWRKGQKFNGIETSIEWHYLMNHLLPFIGYSKDSLQILEENVYYTNITDEMHTLILRMQELISSNRMTRALQISYCLEFLSLLLHPENQKRFPAREESLNRQLRVGKRQIRMTKEDYQKIKSVHEYIRQDAASFLTISHLSQKFQISEQKLKAGFQEIYQQTIWDYAKTIRMNQAVSLLGSTDKSIREISKQVGYQSQAAFHTMFTKWCGVTPGQFRSQIHAANKTL